MESFQVRLLHLSTVLARHGTFTFSIPCGPCPVLSLLLRLRQFFPPDVPCQVPRSHTISCHDLQYFDEGRTHQASRRQPCRESKLAPTRSCASATTFAPTGWAMPSLSGSIAKARLISILSRRQFLVILQQHVVRLSAPVILPVQEPCSPCRRTPY